MGDLTRVALPTGVELDVWDTGPRDAPALVFLHGFPENHRTWRHQVEHLNTRFRCIAPDQRGYGNSSRPQDVSEYAVGNLVGDVFMLAHALEVENFTVIGHDWGGAIAWLVAMFGQAEGRVTRAVIANAPHPTAFQHLLFTDEAQRKASQYMRVFRDKRHDPLVRENGLGALLQQALNWENRPQHDPDELALLMQQWARPENAFAMLNWYRASELIVPSLEAPYVLPPAAGMMELPVLQVPTLVVWGMQDEALLPANVDGLPQVVSDLTVEKIADAGHFVPWEAPEAVNAALDAFLERTA